jgi:hypothetical protein
MNDEEVRDKVSETGKKERDALAGLFKLMLKETDSVYYTVYHTPDQTNSKYDCLVKKFDKATNKVIKKMFIETKIRGAYYDTMLLEKKKLEYLKKFVKDPAIDRIYYINFTPRNTILFDLLKIEPTMFFVEHEHNTLTIDKERGKVKKEVTYLDVTNGIVYDYVYNKPEPIVPFLSEQQVDKILSSQEAFPKEEPVKPVSDPNQIELEIKIPKTINPEDLVVYDENGEITFETLEEFERLPYSIQMQYVMESHLRKFLRPGENKADMIKKYGSLKDVYNFSYERIRLEFVSKYEKIDMFNKYEK